MDTSKKTLTLQCSCKCKQNRLVVVLDASSPLELLQCHCRDCRAHSATTCGVYLADSARRPFCLPDSDHEEPLPPDAPAAPPATQAAAVGGRVQGEWRWLRRGELKHIPTRCETLRKYRMLVAEEDVLPATDPPALELDGRGTRISCARCFSFLMMQFGVGQAGQTGSGTSGAGTSSRPKRIFSVLCAGALDDGCYKKDDKGRRDDEEKWPVRKFPDVLGKHVLRRLELCKRQRCLWWIKKGRMDEDEWTKREKGAVREVREEQIEKVREGRGSAHPTGSAAGKTAGSRSPEEEEEDEDELVMRAFLETRDTYEVEGACYCGACRFQTRIFPGEMQHCYCSCCRKYSGGAFMTWAACSNKLLKWVDGIDLNLADPAKMIDPPKNYRRGARRKDGVVDGGVLREEGLSPTLSAKTGSTTAEERSPSRSAANAANGKKKMKKKGRGSSPQHNSPSPEGKGKKEALPQALHFQKTTGWAGRHVCRQCHTVLTIVRMFLRTSCSGGVFVRNRYNQQIGQTKLYY